MTFWVYIPSDAYSTQRRVTLCIASVPPESGANFFVLGPPSISTFEWCFLFDQNPIGYNHPMSKIAIVTGSSQGIGAATARLLGANGYSVIVTYNQSEAKANEVAKDIRESGGDAFVVQLDVTSEESVKACFQAVAEKYDKLDVLVNNAGVDGLTPIESASFEKWQAITRSKIDGNFLCTQHALPLLKKAGKSDVICLMSNLGEFVDPDDVAYSVGTAGVVAFVKAAAVSLAKYGVRTNGVGPGGVRTDLAYYKEVNMDDDKSWDDMAKRNPLGRIATVDDVAQSILTVVNNPTEFWNGNFIYVSGGSHLKG